MCFKTYLRIIGIIITSKQNIFFSILRKYRENCCNASLGPEAKKPRSCYGELEGGLVVRNPL